MERTRIIVQTLLWPRRMKTILNIPEKEDVLCQFVGVSALQYWFSSSYFSCRLQYFSVRSTHMRYKDKYVWAHKHVILFDKYHIYSISRTLLWKIFSTIVHIWLTSDQEYRNMLFQSITGYLFILYSTKQIIPSHTVESYG